jgi:hypothetical protein
VDLRADVIRLRQVAENAGGKRAGVGWIGYVELQDRELIAAKSRDKIAASTDGFETFSDKLEQLIAFRMAQHVIDVLETIGNQIMDREADAALCRSGACQAHP